MPFRRNLFTGELEKFTSSESGRQVIFKAELPYGAQTVRGRMGDTRAVRPDKPHFSRALGVPTAQVDRFNRELENFGVTEARYSGKTGFLESYDDNHRHAAWAIRGYSNFEGGDTADRWASALGN